MAVRRSYEDGCAGAHALDLIGERWALLIVRELLLGPKRFTDLRAGLPGISPNVLSLRLDELEQAAVMRRRKLPPPFGAWIYELTDWGRQLETVIVELGRWGARSPALPRDAALSADSLILSFRTMFDAQAAGSFRARFELRFGDDRFHVEVFDRRIALARGAADKPDAILESDPNTLAAIAYDGRKLAEAVRSGDLKIIGDKKAAERFLALFTLPVPAPAFDKIP
jgi:DNA-binding HxlR family transcriptional regulator